MEGVSGTDEAGVRRGDGAVPGPAAVFGLHDSARGLRAAGAKVQPQPTAPGAGKQRAGEVTNRAVCEILWVAKARPAATTVVGAEEDVLGAGARAAVRTVARQQP